MPPRTLASLAHALAVAPSVEHALRAFVESTLELDRYSHLSLITVEERRGMMCHRLLASAQGVERARLETTLDHLPDRARSVIATGACFVEFGDASEDYARLLQLPPLNEPVTLAARGILFDGSLDAILVLFEGKKLFGPRTTDRIAAAVELFVLAYLRIREREARHEAITALEGVTQRMHAEHARRLAELRTQLRDATESADGSATPQRELALEQELAAAVEDARRSTRRADAVEATVTAAVSELEKAQVELHRRNEQLRQRTRTLYLLERVLILVGEAASDPRRLADGLLALVADDMHAHRCSLMLRTADGTSLFIAAARGVAPGVGEGDRVALGQGVAGRVAVTREPLLVQDVERSPEHTLLRDDYFTTGSFISFPLEYRGELVGVVNVANRAHEAVFLEEDVDRVRLLGLVIALAATAERLPERLAEALSVR